MRTENKDKFVNYLCDYFEYDDRVEITCVTDTLPKIIHEAIDAFESTTDL